MKQPKLKIDPLTPRTLKFKRSLRKLVHLRVEHDRLRTMFLEDLRQCSAGVVEKWQFNSGAIAFRSQGGVIFVATYA